MIYVRRFDSKGTSKMMFWTKARSSPRSGEWPYVSWATYIACTYKAVSNLCCLYLPRRNHVSGLTFPSQADFKQAGMIPWMVGQNIMCSMQSSAELFPQKTQADPVRWYLAPVCHAFKCSRIFDMCTLGRTSEDNHRRLSITD